MQTLLICNKCAKKLLPVPATLGTVPGHTNLSAGNFKALLPGYSPLHFRAQRTLELYDLAAAETYQVLMLGGWLGFIVVVCLIKVKLFNQTQFLEHPQGPVDSG